MIAIVSVIYKEPEWEQTHQLVEAERGTLRIFIDREGVGSLAEAYNRGAKKALAHGAAYIWFVSNPTWQPGTLQKLVAAMQQTGMAAIHPAFESDHQHICPQAGITDVHPVPFVEFTAPIVRADVFKDFPLDEGMPYWGHDLDWSYRVLQAGYKVGVHYGVVLSHTYIRHNKNMHRITRERYKLRKQTDAATTQLLINKYGNNWKEVLSYK